MNLKEKIIYSYVAFEDSIDVNVDSRVHQIRLKSFDNFEKQGFPTKKDQQWRYTSLREILNTDFSIFPRGKIDLDLKDIRPYLLNDIDSYKLVFVDGVFSSFLSEITHKNYDICVMSSALNKSKYNLFIDNYFNKVAKERNSLAELNTAFSKEGAFIHIPKNTVLQKPIQMIYLSSGEEDKALLQPRNLIIVGENSHVKIIERHQSLTKNQTLTNGVTEIYALKRAIIDYYKVQNDQYTSQLIDNTFVSQKDQSVVSVHTFSFGGRLTRNNLEFISQGENTCSNLNGITLIGGNQLVDNHTLVHHMKPNCDSFENYKGVYMDRSKGVFDGRVIVEPQAQKTNGFQQNSNIIIGDKVSVNAKPQLEIFADDVKCSHGCTIGQLDTESLFYLRSRGIPKKESEALLMYAFSNDTLKDVKIPELKTMINRIIAEKLGVNIGFDI